MRRMMKRTVALWGALALSVWACDAPDTPKPDTTVTTTTAGAASPPTQPATARPGPTTASQKEIPPPEDVAKAPADAEKTPSGLQSKVLTAGSGDKSPTTSDKVKVHYTGWTTDGKMFDSSVTRGQPAEFAVNGVIKGWTEGLQLMKVGEKRRLWIPAALAYGQSPRMGAPAGDLTFDVELLEIIEGPKPPDTPEDLNKPPADAKKTASGLVYRVLTKGTGTTKPTAESRVRVHYSGWTKDGNMFDSSVTRGRPATFPLNGVIKGWTEGVQLMVEGDKFRFWIPADLAYGDKPTRPGAPSGDLVFDVELIKIVR